MRSTDARWHLAVEALARMPELALRLVEVHHADDKGYCRGCTTPGGTLFVRWPCGLYRLATAATAPDSGPAAEPGPALDPGHEAPGRKAAFGPGRRVGFGPGRRRASDPPPAAPEGESPFP
jgi:hypothetical protein